MPENNEKSQVWGMNTGLVLGLAIMLFCIVILGIGLDGVQVFIHPPAMAIVGGMVAGLLLIDPDGINQLTIKKDWPAGQKRLEIKISEHLKGMGAPAVNNGVTDKKSSGRGDLRGGEQ